MDKLGKRLAVEGRATQQDRELFSQVLDFYQEILDVATGRLIASGYLPTSRVKTTGTLVEKLRREHGIQLTRINDIAGARIVVSGGRDEQDVARDKVVKLFEDGSRQPQTIDRRADPRSGYRAVHLVVYVQQFPVEIQIRTELQDSWAQIFERLADQWGRQIRYGGEPDLPDESLVLRVGSTAQSATRRSMLSLLGHLADYINNAEERQRSADRVLRLAAEAEKYASRLRGLKFDGDPSGVPDEVMQGYRAGRPMIVSACRKLILDRRRCNRIIRRSFPSDKFKAASFIRGLDAINDAARRDVLDSQGQRDDEFKIIRAALHALAELPEHEVSQ
jgi:ppGpp synthetase/RelA/SpoT-type nucleotidyltranferase